MSMSISKSILSICIGQPPTADEARLDAITGEPHAQSPFVSCAVDP